MADSAECPKCKAEIYIDDPLHEGECYKTECNECHKTVCGRVKREAKCGDPSGG